MYAFYWTLISLPLIAYADGINIIDLNRRAVTAVFAAVEQESRRLGLTVNEDKSIYMVSTTKEATFEVVNNFVYLGTSAGL